MRRLILAIFILLLTFVNVVNAQIDPHFSQYYAYPLWLNPALTGVFDGDVRLTSNLKDQWSGISDGYKTAAVSGDFRCSDKIALGVSVINQKAGSAGYNYLAAYSSFAYQVAISPSGNHKLNFGLQGGVINRNFDRNKLQMDNQYNPITGYDPSMPSFENFTSTGAAAFDAGAGLFYYDGTPSGTANLFGGISVAHLTSGKDIFANDGVNSHIPMRYTVHSGLRINASGFLDITPHLIYMRQGKSQERAAGLNFEFSLKEGYSLMLGGMYRSKDAFIGNAGFYLKNLIIGLSYDYTTSSLQKMANFQGGYELSLSYVFKRRLAGREQKCPRF